MNCPHCVKEIKCRGAHRERLDGCKSSGGPQEWKTRRATEKETPEPTEVEVRERRTHAPPRKTNDMKNTIDSKTATAPAVACSDWLGSIYDVEVLQDEGGKRPHRWTVRSSGEWDAMQLAFALDGGWGKDRNAATMLELVRAYCSIKMVRPIRKREDSMLPNEKVNEKGQRWLSHRTQSSAAARRKDQMHKIDRDFQKWVSPSNNPKGQRRSLKRRVIQPGQRVLVNSWHPWGGHSGTVRERIKTLAGEMWVVELDNGMKAGCDDYDLKAV